jgi:hypothetical protein
MPYLLARPTTTQRVVDRVLGVSRRRPQLAYAAIGGGLAMLRPVLRRSAVVALASAVYLTVF